MTTAPRSRASASANLPAKNTGDGLSPVLVTPTRDCSSLAWHRRRMAGTGRAGCSPAIPAAIGCTTRCTGSVGRASRLLNRAMTVWSSRAATSRLLLAAPRRTTARPGRSWRFAAVTCVPRWRSCGESGWWSRWGESAGKAGYWPRAGGPGSRHGLGRRSGMVKRPRCPTGQPWWPHITPAGRIPTPGGSPARCGMESSAGSGALWNPPSHDALDGTTGLQRGGWIFHFVDDCQLPH